MNKNTFSPNNEPDLDEKEIFKTKIQMTLYFLSQLWYKDNKIELDIKGKKYSVTELIKPINIGKTYAAMSAEAKKEIDKLYTDDIDNRKLIVDSDYKNKLLVSFLNSIKHFVLRHFNRAKITEVEIGGTSYSIGSLITYHKKKFSYLPTKAQTQLIKLFVDQIDRNKLYNARLDSLLITIKPALRIFADAKIFKVQIGDNLHHISNLIANLEKSVTKLDHNARRELKLLSFVSANDEKLNEKLISIFQNKLDLFLEDIKPVLQVFLSTEININNKIYQIGHLTTNLNQKGSELVDDAKTELMKLFIDKINGQKLTTLLPPKLKLDVFFETIKPSLQSLFDMDIIAVIINEKVYPIGYLTTNLDKKGSELVDQAKDQLLVLYNHDFNFKTIIESFKENLINHKTALDNYKNEIQSTLQNLTSARLKKIEINGTTYQLNFLLKMSNLQLVGSKLLWNAKKQLLYLMGGNITKTLLADALTTILKTSAAETTILQTPKKQNQKKLIIGLSVAGVVLTLSAFGGGLYWFFKIKK